MQVMMRLADFIQNNTDEILAEWESFARSLPVGGGLQVVALRDHAREMLAVIASDLAAPQTAIQQFHKARGRSDASSRTPPTPAQAHGADRADLGFTVDQMIAEFRALRASVIRSWLKHGHVAEIDLQDMIRFNEAIDQAIAESITRFSADIARTKERFLAILSHDLRTPLNAVLTSSVFMIERGELVEPYNTLVSGIASSARRMTRLVTDLFDFTRTRFGDSMPIVVEATDVRLVVHGVVAEIGAAHPDTVIQIETSGLLRGKCDPHRIAQALTNVISNAVQHGSPQAPIKVSALGTLNHCVLSVHSFGPVIPAERLGTLFEPVEAGADRRHLGLGLYIVEKIIAAHGGSVVVRSDRESGTVVEMHFPL
jgi:signal transduction histidine kinase